jgi:hypothetical protein
MATIKVPSNVSSITFTSSGVKAASSGLITGITAVEATVATSPYSANAGYKGIQYTDGQAAYIYLPSVISSITINGNVYAVTSGVIGPVPAADVAVFIGSLRNVNALFQLVTG